VPYQIETVDDLVRILKEHPEWRERLREVLLTDEERQLPELVRELVSAVRELVQSHQQALTRLDRLEESQRRLIQSHQQLIESHQQLSESHRQLVESHQRLSESHQQLVENHQRLSESHRQLVESHQRLSESHQQLVESHQQAIARLDRLEAIVEDIRKVQVRLEADIAVLKGDVMELKFDRRGAALFGPHLRRPKVVPVADFVDELREAGHPLSEEEWGQLFALDGLLTGRHPRTGEQIYFAVELSWIIHHDDVQRAVERANLLRRCGIDAYPAVVGQGVHPDAGEALASNRVLMMLNGALYERGILAE